MYLNFSLPFIVPLSITLLVINEGGLLKNDTFDETSIPSFEQVIKYVQRLCFVYTE